MKLPTAEVVTDYFIKNDVIPSEDKDIYVYGLQQGFLIIINIVTMLIIGAIFNMIWHSIIFLLAYIPIRTYAGGYHAKNKRTCYLLSIIMMSLVLILIKSISWSDVFCFALLVFGAAIIILLAPVEDKNKPFSQTEKSVFKKRTRIILSILSANAIIFRLAGYQQGLISTTMAIAALCVMLILGKIKNKKSYDITKFYGL